MNRKFVPALAAGVVLVIFWVVPAAHELACGPVLNPLEWVR